jgi:hypothetical protein
MFTHISLAWSSSKLFYSQRLGIFGDPDPSILMILQIIPFIMALLVGPLSYYCFLILQQSLIIFTFPPLRQALFMIIKWFSLEKNVSELVLKNCMNLAPGSHKDIK